MKMTDNPGKGKILFEVHAVCGRCKRRVRLAEKVESEFEAEQKLKEIEWIKTEQSGWLCFVCKETERKELK